MFVKDTDEGREIREIREKCAITNAWQRTPGKSVPLADYSNFP